MPSAPLWAYSEENLSLICSSEKPAGFLELLFSQEESELSDAVFLCGPFCEKCNTGQTAVCPVLL